MNLNMKKLTILKGEGIHQHTLYGNFSEVEEVIDFQPLEVFEKSFLKHEKPDGSFSNEHKTLEVSAGTWVMGRQVEYNPFTREVTNVWD